MSSTSRHLVKLQSLIIRGPGRSTDEVLHLHSTYTTLENSARVHWYRHQPTLVVTSSSLNQIMLSMASMQDDSATSGVSFQRCALCRSQAAIIDTGCIMVRRSGRGVYIHEVLGRIDHVLSYDTIDYTVIAEDSFSDPSSCGDNGQYRE